MLGHRSGNYRAQLYRNNKLGDCPNGCPTDKTCADKMATACPECGSTKGLPHLPLYHRIKCSNQLPSGMPTPQLVRPSLADLTTIEIRASRAEGKTAIHTVESALRWMRGLLNSPTWTPALQTEWDRYRKEIDSSLRAGNQRTNRHGARHKNHPLRTDRKATNDRSAGTNVNCYWNWDQPWWRIAAKLQQGTKPSQEDLGLLKTHEASNCPEIWQICRAIRHACEGKEPDRFGKWLAQPNPFLLALYTKTGRKRKIGKLRP